MSCPWRSNPGSGYDKPCNPALAKSNKEALERLQAARATERLSPDSRTVVTTKDVSLAAMWKESAGGKKKEEQPKQRYIMKGD